MMTVMVTQYVLTWVDSWTLEGRAAEGFWRPWLMKYPANR